MPRKFGQNFGKFGKVHLERVLWEQIGGKQFRQILVEKSMET